MPRKQEEMGNEASHLDKREKSIYNIYNIYNVCNVDHKRYPMTEGGHYEV